jgi:hypothetical protein
MPPETQDKLIAQPETIAIALEALRSLSHPPRRFTRGATNRVTKQAWYDQHAALTRRLERMLKGELI